MLNSTFIALSLRCLSSISPFVSNQQNIYMSKSTIFNSINSFIYNVNSASYFIKGSTFGNFLNSAILIQKESMKYNTIFTERPVQPNAGDAIICFDSIFINCSSKLDGGAVSHFSSFEGTLDVQRTTFVNCNSGPAPGDGGCIYFTGQKSNIDSCCVLRCSAGRDGHSFCISIRSPLSSTDSKNTNDYEVQPNYCNRTSITQSSPKKSARGWQSLYLGFGKIRIIDLNSTENAVVSQAGSFMMHTMDSDAVALHCTIAKNIGPWIVYLYAKFGSAIEESNFVGNLVTKQEESGLIMFHKLGQLNNCFISHLQGKLFKGNREGAEITVNNCVFDVEFDNEPGVIRNNCRFDIKGVMTLPLAHFNTELCASQRDLSKNPIQESEILMIMKNYFKNPSALLNRTKI